ncbi:MAG: hypothetical protein ABEI58_00090 [Candidatus Nanohaloarchaea archaeon]
MADFKTFEALKEGDHVLFNERKVPLEVSAVDENRVHIDGPHGGEYVMFVAEDTDDLLVRNKKSGRRYATYVEDLREVGEWTQEDENRWTHSKTGAFIQLAKNDSGFWTIETDLDTELDLPKYGYSQREFAVEDIEKLMEKNPEGE